MFFIVRTSAPFWRNVPKRKKGESSHIPMFVLTKDGVGRFTAYVGIVEIVVDRNNSFNDPKKRMAMAKDVVSQGTILSLRKAQAFFPDDQLDRLTYNDGDL